MNTSINIKRETERVDPEGWKEELQFVLHAAVGSLFERHRIELQFQDIIKSSRNPFMSAKLEKEQPREKHTRTRSSRE